MHEKTHLQVTWKPAEKSQSDTVWKTIDDRLALDAQEIRILSQQTGEMHIMASEQLVRFLLADLLNNETIAVQAKRELI